MNYKQICDSSWLHSYRVTLGWLCGNLVLGLHCIDEIIVTKATYTLEVFYNTC